MRFTGQSINLNVKVLFANNPIKETPHDETLFYSGICIPFTRTVFLDRAFWNYHRNNEKIRESSLFHELAHCDLNRKHNDGFDARQPSFSFMHIENLKMFNFSEDINERKNQQCSQESIEEFIRRESYPPTSCTANLALYYYETALDSDLDKVFEEMYKELFSMRNTRSSVITGLDVTRFFSNQCFVSYRYQFFESFDIPLLKHLTVGSTLTPNFESFYITREREIRKGEFVAHSTNCNRLLGI